MRALHFVQLFDDAESLCEAVADFVQQGLTDGDRVLLVMTHVHWLATEGVLLGRGVVVDGAVSSGRLVVRDAVETMKLFMRHGRPRRSLFEQTVVPLVRTLASYGTLRIYGEMVDVLASEGDLDAALELEELWNDLGARQPFTLFCGYSAVHFGNPMSSAALRSICEAHAHVRSNSRDMLATFLVSSAAHAT